MRHKFKDPKGVAMPRMSKKSINRLRTGLWISLVNSIIYPFAKAYGSAQVISYLGLIMCVINLPSAIMLLNSIDKNRWALSFKRPTLKNSIKTMLLSMACIIGLVILKQVYFPYLAMINWNTFYLSILSIYCFICVPIQEIVIRGIMHTAFKDILLTFMHSKDQSLEFKDDIAQLLSNYCFFYFHTHKGIGFSVFSFAMGLFWADMASWDNNLLYPILSHMAVGGVGYLLSFDVMSHSILAMGIGLIFV